MSLLNFEPEMQCILVDFVPNVVLFIISEGNLFPLLVAPQEPALTRRTPVLSSENLFPLLVAPQELALTRRTPALPPSFREALVRNGQHQCRPWVACLPNAWPSRPRSMHPMLSPYCHIPGRRRLLLCASCSALCQPMSDVSFPIAQPSEVKRSRCQGCSHAVEGS